MPIAISDSIDALVNRIESVLQNQLPTYVGARDTADYPLPVPAFRDYVVAKTDLISTVDTISEQLGNPDVFVAMMYGPSPLENATADLGDYNQITEVKIAIILRESIGEDLPSNDAGRTLLMTEWMEKRAEKYRGILQDVVTKHVADGTNINGVRLKSSGVSDSFGGETGSYREAGVSFDVTQQVSVNVPDYS